MIFDTWDIFRTSPKSLGLKLWGASISTAHFVEICSVVVDILDSGAGGPADQKLTSSDKHVNQLFSVRHKDFINMNQNHCMVGTAFLR